MSKPPISSAPFRGRQEAAVYRMAELPAHSGNPFITSLPPIQSPEQVHRWMGRFPRFDPALRQLPIHMRAHQLDTIPVLVTPVAEHIQLERKLSRLLRKGYIGRNPMASDAFAKLSEPLVEFADGSPAPTPPSFRNATTGMSLIGPSGVGKTTCIELLLSRYPQVITHTMFDGQPFVCKQLVWVKMECPPDGSIKGLCKSFFQEVDDILGSNFATTHGHGRATLDELIPGVGAVAAAQGLGLLVIDEIQNLNQAKSGGVDLMLNFFVRLANQVGSPIVLVGTPGALDMLERRFRQGRRMSGLGDFRWMPMSRGATWTSFLNTLWRYQYTQHEVPLASAYSEVLYEECQGIADIAVKIFLLAQLRAMETGAERLSVALIKSVAKDELGLVRPLLLALRRGDQRALSEVGHLRLDIDEAMQEGLERFGAPEASYTLPVETPLTVSLTNPTIGG